MSTDATGRPIDADAVAADEARAAIVRGERKFEYVLTWALLIFAVWYGVRMAMYPANAGRVPAIVATVMAAVLIFQLLGMSIRRAPQPAPQPGDGEPTVATLLVSDDGFGASLIGSAAAEALPEGATMPEIEPDDYEHFIALTGVRRFRFLSMIGFIVAFYVGTLLVGFVITSAVMMVVLMLIARERIQRALFSGLVVGGGVYLMAVYLAKIPPFEGYL